MQLSVPGGGQQGYNSGNQTPSLRTTEPTLRQLSKDSAMDLKRLWPRARRSIWIIKIRYFIFDMLLPVVLLPLLLILPLLIVPPRMKFRLHHRIGLAFNMICLSI